MVELAAGQHGVVSLPQLTKLGFTPTMLRKRLEAGRLYRVQPKVYSLLPSLKSAGRMMAAVLSCGPGAALSHRAAAAIWDLGPWPTGAVDVSVAKNKGPRRGVRIHRVTELEAMEKDGFPVTTPSRTLIDCARTEPRPRVERMWEQADRLGLLDIGELDGSRSRVLQELIEERREAPPSKNELERAFLDVCREHTIAVPSLNAVVQGEEVDAYWPQDDLVVELDGYEWHKTRAAFENDRRRDAKFARAGLRVLRFSWRQVTRQPRDVAEAIVASKRG